MITVMKYIIAVMEMIAYSFVRSKSGVSQELRKSKSGVSQEKVYIA